MLDRQKRAIPPWWALGAFYARTEYPLKNCPPHPPNEAHKDIMTVEANGILAAAEADVINKAVEW